MLEKSPKSERVTEPTKKEQFSPVKPLSAKPSQGKNLTGPARLVRDLAADVHACVQQWNTVHLQGLTILKNITQEKQDESYSQTLQELCDKLEKACDSLDLIVKNLEQVVHQMKVIPALNKSTGKLFMTWSATKFGDVAELIYNAYSEEAQVKRRVLEEVAHDHTESWKMLCLATWVHQLLLPERVATMLESLLLETGHR